MATSAEGEHLIIAGILHRGSSISLSFLSVFKNPVVKYSLSERGLHT